MRESNGKLTEEVDDIKKRVMPLEQYSRKTNIEIEGIPVSNNENVVSVATDVGAAVGVELKLEATHSADQEQKAEIDLRFQKKHGNKSQT